MLPRRPSSTFFLEKTSDSDNLALREFGGECNDLDSTRLVLPFAPGERRLANEVNGLTTTRGRSTLVNAIIEATGDFSGQEFQKSKSGIIVIAGSYEGCGDGNADAAIQERLKRYPGLTLDMRFIGVALTRQAQSFVGGLARKTGGTFKNARTPAELDDAVEHALVVETKVSEVQQAVVILNECMTHLNTAVREHLGSSLDYQAADQKVGEAERALKRTMVPPSDPQQPEGVRGLLEIARQARDEQQKMLEATRALIAAKKAGDAAEEARAIGAYNSSAKLFNNQTDDIVRRQIALLKSSISSSIH